MYNKFPCYYPGDFNPPTKYHLNTMEWLLGRPEIGHVYIVIGNNDQNQLTQEKKVKLWEMLIRHSFSPNVSILKSKDDHALNEIKNSLGKKRDTPFFIAMDEKMARNKDMQEHFSDFSNFQIEIIPSQFNKSSQQMIQAVLDKDDKTIRSLVPQEFSDQSAADYVNIMKQQNDPEAPDEKSPTIDYKTHYINKFNDGFWKEVFEPMVNEVISPKEATDPIKSVQTILDNKRNIAYFTQSDGSDKQRKEALEMIKAAGLKAMYVKGNANDAYVIFRSGSEKDATELKDIAEKHGGYLPYDMPEEDTRRVGQLLSYKPDEIEDFIKKNTKKTESLNTNSEEEVNEIDFKKAAAVAAMTAGLAGSPNIAKGQNFQGIKDKFKQGITAVQNKLKPQQKVDTIYVKKDAPLQLQKYKDDKEVGYGIAQHRNESSARQMSHLNASVDLMKKLGKTQMTAGMEIVDSKMYQLPDGTYKAETIVKISDIKEVKINEIADTPYTLSSPKESKPSAFDIGIDYTFTTDNGREYYVRFGSRWVGRNKNEDQKYNWATELTFFPSELKQTGDPGELGDENFGKILASVAEAVKSYVQKYKPEYLYWKGIKTDQEVQKSKTSNVDITKRQRIYNLFMNREVSKLSGYKPTVGDKRSSVEYENEIPVKDADDIFKYPEEPSMYNKADSEKKLSRFNLSR